MNLIALQTVFLLAMAQGLVFAAIYDVDRWGRHLAAAALSLVLGLAWAAAYTRAMNNVGGGLNDQPPPPQ